MPGLSDRRLVRVVSATLTPPSLTSRLCPSSCLRVCLFLVLFLLRCLISLTADWSGLSALPPPPTPLSACLVWTLERSSGLSDRRLVRIVRLPSSTNNSCPIAGALKLLAFGFSDRRLVRISVACVSAITLTQKGKVHSWLLTSQGFDLYHSLHGTTHSTGSCTIMG